MKSLTNENPKLRIRDKILLNRLLAVNAISGLWAKPKNNTMLNQLKFVLIVLLALSRVCVLLGAEVSVSVTPNPLFAGETAQYQIVSTVGKPSLKSFPELNGIQWNKNAPYSSVQIVNFDRTDMLTYTFTVSKPGNYVIPAVKIRLGNRVVKSNPVKITVQERRFRDKNQTLTLDDLIFWKITYNKAVDPPKKLYLGQEVTLTIKLYVDSRLEIYADKFNHSNSFTNPKNFFPTLNLDNVVFRDYSKQNKYDSKFLYVENQPEIIAGNRFQVFTYQTGVSGVEVGTIQGTIEHTVPILDRSRQQRTSRDRFDDFFGFPGSSRRSQIFTHPVQADIRPISIIAIPKDENESGHYLGLIGSWNVELSVDRSSVAVGDDITLTLNIRGTGNVAPLSAPELEIPGFRIYPPEITRGASSEGQGMIKWVIIPLSTSSQLPEMKFKTFNPESETFEMHKFQPTLRVEAAEIHTPSGPIIEDYAEKSKQELATSREIHRASDILYIKKDLGQTIRLPLWRNVDVLVPVVAMLGPICYVIAFFLTLQSKRLKGSLSYKRRRDALRNRRRLFQAIRRSSPEGLSSIIREDLIPFLQAILNLPPGATNTELLEKIDDSELTEILKQAEVGGFMPGQEGSQIDSRALLSKIKRLLLIVLSCVISANGYAQDRFQEAERLYDQGRINDAVIAYQNLLEENSGNPALLFNLGNCAYRKGDYGNAVLYYERARRLKPRDSDITENLNFVRAQLNLPAVKTTDTPSALIATLRDQLRPDEWLLCASVLWCMMWITMSFSRIRRFRLTPIGIILGIILIVSLIAYFAQNHSTYAKNQGIIVAQDTPIFRLPKETGEGKAKFILSTGDYVEIVERRSEWSRVRIDQDEGWLKNKALKSIWK